MAKTTKKRRRLWGRVKPDPNIYYRTYKKKKGLESFDSKPFFLVREMGLEPIIKYETSSKTGNYGNFLVKLDISFQCVEGLITLCKHAVANVRVHLVRGGNRFVA